jgi:hypothetical protein
MTLFLVFFLQVIFPSLIKLLYTVDMSYTYLCYKAVYLLMELLGAVKK